MNKKIHLWFILLIFLIVLLFPQFLFKSKTEISPEKFSEEWYKECFEWIRLLFTFWIANIFWKNLEKEKENNNDLNIFRENIVQTFLDVKEILTNILIKDEVVYRIINNNDDFEINRKKLLEKIDYLIPSIEYINIYILPKANYNHSWLVFIDFTIRLVPIIKLLQSQLYSGNLTNGNTLTNEMSDQIDVIINFNFS